MNKKELVDRLNAVYMDIENIPSDSTLFTIIKDLQKVLDNLVSIISEIEDEGIKEEIEEKE